MILKNWEGVLDIVSTISQLREMIVSYSSETIKLNKVGGVLGGCKDHRNNEW